MAQIDVPRTYEDGQVLLQSDLDGIVDGVETFINVTKLNDDNIQNAGITAFTKLANASITKVKMATDSVGSSQIEADAVTTAKIDDDAVTTAKIDDGAVTTAKIVDGAVTRAKQAALGQQISSSSGNYTTTSATAVDVTNLSVTIATTGRPVFVGLQPDGTTTEARVSVTAADTDDATGFVLIVRDSDLLAKSRVEMRTQSGSSTTDPQMLIPVGSVWVLDTPSAGTYTYKIQGFVGNSSDDTLAVRFCKLVAFEL